jgi:hypothetical protein
MEAAALLQAYKEKNLQEVKALLLSELPKDELYAPLENYLKEQAEDLKKRLKDVSINPDGEEGQNFKGLLHLHQNFDQKLLNALPPHFANIRDEIAFAIAIAARDLPSSYTSLSSGLFRYAGKLKISNENLEDQINQLLKKKEDEKRWENVLANEARQRKTTRNYLIIGASILGLVLFGIWGMNWYENWKQEKAVAEGGNGNTTTTSTSTSAPAAKKKDTNEEWFKNERLLAASFSLDSEVIKDIKNKSNVESELKALDFRFGNDPMECYTSYAFDCNRPAKSITVHGDKKHDAILFLLWNARVGRQVYIKKNTSFYVWVNKYEEVSTAVIFGNEWDDNLDNPCGGKGFFSKDVIYAPPLTYCTIPLSFDTSEPKLKLRLRHGKLLPKQIVNQERFMYLMTDYD